jgi:glycerophosphoryl diester phosphodiesterase
MKKHLFSVALMFLSSLFISQTMAQAQSCLVVGHRGSSKIAPENTIASAKLAWEQGADAVEIDVHLTSDNKIAVIHDKNTKRTAEVDYMVSETPYSTLKELDVGSWKGKEYKGEPIPLLEDIVSIIPKGKMLVVEIKSDRKIVPYIKNTIGQHENLDQLIFIAFSYEAIIDAKKAFPENKAFWLSSSFKEKSEQVLSKVKTDGLDGVDLHYRLVSAELVQIASELGLEVHTWTVNDEQKAMELQNWGVNSITTDIPDKILVAISHK